MAEKSREVMYGTADDPDRMGRRLKRSLLVGLAGLAALAGGSAAADDGRLVCLKRMKAELDAFSRPACLGKSPRPCTVETPHPFSESEREEVVAFRHRADECRRQYAVAFYERALELEEQGNYIGARECILEMRRADVLWHSAEQLWIRYGLRMIPEKWPFGPERLVGHDGEDADWSPLPILSEKDKLTLWNGRRIRWPVLVVDSSSNCSELRLVPPSSN